MKIQEQMTFQKNQTFRASVLLKATLTSFVFELSCI